MVLAQFGQTGSINGTVKDSEGAPLPGVGVTIKSPALILPEMNTLTNQQGIYRFPSLAPGKYEVTYALQGMSTLVRKDIIITASNTTTIDVTLELMKLNENIVVTGQTPTVDIQSTTRTTNLDKDFLASIPGFRVLDAYFNMTPGVVSESSAGGGPMSSANGGAVRDNAFKIDGVSMSAPDVGTQKGEVGMDIMEELSIQSGGLPAEYGDTQGTLVNVVTKSGGNTFSGSASFYYNSDKLQSDNTKGTALEGRFSGYKYIYEPGITLGGPIIKDRLWFFTNLGLTKRAVNIAGFPYDQATTVPALETRYNPYFKLTFVPSQKNKFVLSYVYANLIQDNAGASPNFTEEATFKWDAPQHILNAQWTHFFNDSFFADLKVGYLASKDNLVPINEGAIYVDVLTNRYSGAYPFKDLYSASRLQGNVNLTYFKDNFVGSHEFKLGGEFQATDATEDFIPARDPRNGLSQILTADGYPLFGIWFSEKHDQAKTMDFSAFVQDTWKPAKRLAFNLGLRFSHQRGIIPAQNESEGPQTFLGANFNRSVTSAYTPIKRTNISPRVGLIYDIVGDGKTLFKASYSRYIQANLMQYFTEVNPNSIWDYVQLLNPDFTPMPDGYLDANFPNPGKVGYGNVKLKSPYTDEFTIGLERELFTGWSLALRYMKRMDRNLLEDANASQLDIDKLVNNGELVWTNWTQVSFVDPYDGQQEYFWSQNEILPADMYMINPPGAKRDFDGIEVVLNKRYSQGWSLMASYVYQNSRGLIGTDYVDSWSGADYYDDPNAHINAVGKLLLNRPHQFKLQGMVKGPWGVNVGGYFRAYSGQRYTRQVSSYDLGIDVNQGEATVNAETRGIRSLPAQVILDLRLEKTFHLQRITFGIFADCFNLFNGNKATEVQIVSSSSAIVFGQMVAIQDPRIFRLGARFEF
jgi:hypothetical protein